MNERIKDAWEKAAQAHSGDSWAEQTAFLEKFAELIVKECIEVFSKDLPDPTSSDYQLGTLNEVVDRVCNVTEHFGFEK